MRELLSVGTMLLAFAGWVTAHVAIVWTLLLRRPRRRALAAVLIPPLAPWWALGEGHRVRAALWVFTLAAYVVARCLA